MRNNKKKIRLSSAWWFVLVIVLPVILVFFMNAYLHEVKKDEMIIDLLGFVIIPLIICFAFVIIMVEREARKRAEHELQTTRESLKKLCEACIKENNSVHARITYAVYFGPPVDHTGDGFIDGEE